MNIKREKFIRLAENRVNKALNDIRLIGNLSNKNNYDYDQADVNKIISTLEQEVRSVKKKFETVQQSNKKFKLLRIFKWKSYSGNYINVMVKKK